MKRFIKVLVLTVAMALPILLAAPSLVYADPPQVDQKQTKKQATACLNKFDFNKTKKTYRDGPEVVNVQKDKCFADSGNCLMQGAGDTTGTYKVQCTKTPGTNKAARDEIKEESEEATDALNDSSEYHGDPALNSTCTRDRCDIIGKYVNPAINLLTVLVGLAVVAGIVFGAIQVISSTGDPQKAASGKNHIRNALIGLVGYILLYAFLQFVIPGGI